MKNKLSDLNNHLFAQLERLGDESLTEERLIHEVNRSKAITQLATQVINNANLVLDAQKAVYDGQVKELPESMRIEGPKA